MLMSSRLPIIEHMQFISNVNRTGYVKGTTTIKKIPSMLSRQLSAITIIFIQVPISSVIKYSENVIICIIL